MLLTWKRLRDTIEEGTAAGGAGPEAGGRGENGWEVLPPIARFIEPAALLALRDGSTHGYGLAEDIGNLLGVPRVDYGNLYRLLRRLEHEGLVQLGVERRHREPLEADL